jgi:uncharacterized RDD family membrane protein YckC
MNCPECQNGEINSSGECLACGHQMPEESSMSERVFEDNMEDTERSIPEGVVELNYSAGAEESSSQDEIPQWRKELSERLQAIKRKKHAAGLRTGFHEIKTTKEQSQSDEAAIALRAEIMARMKARKPAPKPPAPIPLQKTLQPLKPEPPEVTTSLNAPDPRKIQNLIDTMVSRPPTPSDGSLPFDNEPRTFFDSLEDPEGKLILLSRTLSGLVDLICVVLCTGIFILAADYFSGIIVLDSISFIYFSILFLLTYFVYSIFFLASSSQTIGMMITDLRVVRMDASRPTLGQLLGRCCCYLASLFGLGIGLLWSLVSREHLCLHDRVSGTQIVRT